MKVRNSLALVALAALLAVSCQKDTGRQDGTLSQAGISVQASVSQITKTVTEGNQTSFVSGDKLALYSWTGSAISVSENKVVDGVVNTFDGSTWTPEEPMLWKNVTEAHFFLGIFPAREVEDFTADAVTSDEDLLVATILGDGIKAPQTTTAEPVDLVFDHMMAKLNINVRYRNQWGGVPEGAVVTAKAAPEGTIDYLSKTITPGEVTAQELVSTTAAAGYSATYTSLCIPQEGVRTVQFSIEGENLVYTHGEDLPLEAGKVTTLSLVVGKDKIVLDDNTVSDWEEGEIENPSDPVSAQLGDVTRPLTLKAAEDGTTVTFRNKSRGTVTWITSDGRTGNIIRNATGSISLDKGQKVWFLGNGSNRSYSDGDVDGSSLISMNKDCEAYGNVMSLLTPDFAELTTLPDNNTFSYLFKGQTHLKNNADEGLILPATTPTNRCYRGMFQDCTALTQLVVNATSLETGFNDWLSGVTGEGFALVTPVPLQWRMGDVLPWGATVYAPGENGPEKVYTAPTIVTETLTYNGTAQKLIKPGTAHKDGLVLEYSPDAGNTWGTAIPTGTDARNYSVYCRVKDGDAYSVESAAMNKTIQPKVVTSPTITLSQTSYTYNGSACKPSVTSVKDGNNTIASSEYTVGYSNNINAGTATVTITDKSGGNYTVSGSKTFTINKANPTFSLSASNVSFGASDAVNATKTVTITYNGDGTLSASSNNTGLVTVSRNNKTLTLTRKNAGSGSCTITVSASAGKNYNAPSNKTISVSLTPNVTEWTFGFYTSGNLYEDWVQSFTVPTTGYYWLEVWGGQGGGREGVSGANGGYAKGKAYLTAGTILYITVGGQGADAEGTGATPGGFNGGAVGGYGFFDDNWQSNAGCGGGGGATHISLDKSYIESFNYNQYPSCCVESLKSTRYMIVAGGGGGSGKSVGTPGGTSATTYNNGAKSGGENGLGDGLGISSAGGGGGLEGGKAESPTKSFPGGYGGLSAYNSSYVSDFSHTTGARSGNGQAKITYILP